MTTHNEIIKCIKDPVYFIETYCNQKLNDKAKEAVKRLKDGSELLHIHNVIKNLPQPLKVVKTKSKLTSVNLLEKALKQKEL